MDLFIGLDNTQWLSEHLKVSGSLTTHEAHEVRLWKQIHDHWKMGNKLVLGGDSLEEAS